MSNSSLKNGHIYAVDFDSYLGVQMKTYVSRCNACASAIRDFLRSLNQKYAFPVNITDDTVYSMSDDCEAGGLLSVIIPKESFDPAALSPRALMLWDAITLTDDADHVYVLPRVEAYTHYIKYGKAVRFMEHGAADWEFMPPTPREAESGKKLHVFTYDEVRNKIRNDDRDALITKPGSTPSASVRLAKGRQFVLNDNLLEHLSDRYGAEQEYFAEAVALYKEWMSLPSVPANTLARLLHLDVKQSDMESVKELCYCEWRTDAENSRFLIHTGMTSQLLQMREIDDPSLLSVFK